MFQETLPERRSYGGMTFEFARMGAGPTLVYLHGCDGISQSDPFVAPLEQNFDVVLVSLPGFGESEVLEGTRSVEDIARYLDRALLSLGLRDVVLVGSSFGGWVAMEMALRASPLVAKLVLAAPLGARFSNRPDELEIRDIFTIALDDIPGRMISNPALANAAFSGMRFSDMPDGSALRFCRNREALARFGWSPLLHDPGLAKRLGDIHMPTLIVSGSEDAILAPRYAEKIAEAIPDADLQVFEHAGHYIPMEMPAEFANQIALFAN